MNKIEEIALRVAEQIEPRGRTYSPDHYVDVVKLVLAELSKDAAPACWITPDGEGWRMRTDPPIKDTKLGWTPLFTSPLNTADIEQRVAEACAKSSEAYGESLNNDWNKGLGVADDLLAWPTSAPKQSAPDSGGISYKSP